MSTHYFSSDFWTPDRVELLRALWARGTKNEAIAATLGTNTQAMRRKAQRLGLVRGRTAAAAAPSGAGAAVLALKRDSCRFGFGHPNEASFRFCCEPVLPGKSFCPAHHAVVFMVVPGRDVHARTRVFLQAAE